MFLAAVSFEVNGKICAMNLIEGPVRRREKSLSAARSLLSALVTYFWHTVPALELVSIGALSLSSAR